MDRPFSYVVAEGGARLDVFLAKASGQSREFTQEQIDASRVCIDGHVVKKASRKVQAGETVSGCFVETPPPELTPVERKLEILFEDEDFLALNKEQGVVVHPAPGTRGPTLVHYLLHHLGVKADFLELSPTRPGIVHRLDRGTSGVILVAKHRQAQDRLSQQFKGREIKKEYEAIAWGAMRELGGLFSAPVGRDPVDRKRMSSRAPDAREASTRWRQHERFAHFTHVALFPETGRTHQLRAHLSEAAHPIVGDDLYGLRRQRSRDGLTEKIAAQLDATTQTYLHARRLDLTHPRTGKAMTLEAKRPENFERLLALLQEEDR